MSYTEKTERTYHPGRMKFVCLLIVMTLFLGGCSVPLNLDKSIFGNRQASNEPETESRTSSSSGEAEWKFDFNQPLSLKVPEPAAGEAPRILFVGNSHTYTNDLPAIFSQIVEAMGHGCYVEELCKGSYSLTQFADPSDEFGAMLNRKLTEEEWEFVILQEKTTEALIYAKENMLPAAGTLDEKIRAAGGQTGLLMTWAPKEGAGTLSMEYFQTILSQNLIGVSGDLDSLLISGGMAFMRCMEQYPQIELWGEDGQHPSLEGSYLAACVAYVVIFQESPEGCTYTADLDEETAAQLQTLAAGFLVE